MTLSIEDFPPEKRQSVEWKMRHIQWLLPRIAGTDEDKEQFLAMFEAALDESFYEGTMEAKALIDRMAADIDQQVPLSFVSKWIGELARTNREPPPPDKLGA